VGANGLRDHWATLVPEHMGGRGNIRDDETGKGMASLPRASQR